jgi:hypothetical protein
MSSYIDLASSTYSNLSQYAIFSDGELTATHSKGVAVKVDSGYWYGAISSAADITNGTLPSGYNNALSAGAYTELNTLISNIQTVTSNLDTIDITGATVNGFIANKNYISTVPGSAWTGETISFDAGDDPNAQFFITADLSTLTFTNCTFVLGNAKPCNIFWLCIGPEPGSFTTINAAVPGIIITEDAITFTNNAASNITYNGHIYAKGNITMSADGAGDIIINSSTCPYIPGPGPEPNPGPIVCYAKGTLILTKQGFIPIENIKENYKIVTKGKIYKNKFIKIDANLELTPVLWVGKFKVVDLNKKSRPICIKKNALGKNSPFRDLYVSPRHSLLINGKKVLAKNIINGTTIFQDNECDSVEYYHLECKDHCVIIANGILSESYLDVNNRDVFENSIIINNTKLNNLVHHES